MQMAKATQAEDTSTKKRKRGQGEGSIFYIEAKKLWCAKATIGKDENGKQKRKEFYGKTRKEVQEKLTAAVNDINNDVYIEPSKMLLSQWLRIWLEEYKKRSLKPSSYASFHQYIKNHINPSLGHYKLKELRVEAIQKFINELSDKGLASRTVDSIYVALRGALQQAVINGHIIKNPSDSIIKPRTKEGRKSRALTEDEQNRFIEVALRDFKEYQSEIFVLALFTGLRLGELLALTWDDIDFENGILSVNKAEMQYMDYTDQKPRMQRMVSIPKTKGSIREIPLIPELIEMLKKYKETSLSHDMVFYTIASHSSKSRITYRINNICDSDVVTYLPRGTVVSRFKAITKAAEIEGISIHSLRHTFATRGLENGIELKVMQELLGHSTIKMTADLYTHVLPNKKKDSVMKLREIWKGTH